MKRSTSYSFNALTLILIVLAILAAFNFISFRHPVKFDFTKQKLFSLAPQSIKVVKALTEEVRIIGFFKAQEKPLFDDLIDKYTYHTDKLKAEFIDPDKDVAIAKQHMVKKYRTILVQKGKQEARIDDLSDENGEEKLTNAIIKVGKEKKPILYFLKGHDEKSFGDPDREGFSQAKEELEDEGYIVKDFSLLEKGEIPADGNVVIIAGPQKPFLPPEVSLLESYLTRGGRVLVLLDPIESPVGIEGIFEKIGISVEQNIVVDPLSTLFGQGAATPVISSYSSHMIVRDMKLASFYPMARSLSIAKKLPNELILIDPLASTSPSSWGEKGKLVSKQVKFDEGTDLKGPLHLAVAAEGYYSPEAKKQEQKVRLVVVGDSDFANNRSFSFSGNGNLFLNSVAWLVEDETSISIRPNLASAGRFVMTPAQVRRVFFLTVIIVPFFIVGSGVVVWWRRRKLA